MKHFDLSYSKGSVKVFLHGYLEKAFINSNSVAFSSLTLRRYSKSVGEVFVTFNQADPHVRKIYDFIESHFGKEYTYE